MLFCNHGSEEVFPLRGIYMPPMFPKKIVKKVMKAPTNLINMNDTLLVLVGVAD
jgi:hypothetical protein